MILKEIENGDIFQSDCELIVNPVNCIGVMGKGLALEFKNRFKSYFYDYKSKCENNEIRLGLVDLWSNRIISFPTKNHWRDKSKLSDIKHGLFSLYECVTRGSYRSIAIPAIGCGLGGLKYEDVKSLVRYVFEDVDIEIELYKPKE